MLLHFPQSPGPRSTSLYLRPALLLVVYECVPGQPPEAGLGWTRVMDAAREFEVHAIVGPDSFEQIQRYRQGNRLPPSVHFHTVATEDRLYRSLLRLGRETSRFWAYRRWHWLAYVKAQELHRERVFSLVHQVNLADFSEPGYAAQLGVPFIWGPASGTEVPASEFLSGLSLADQIAERVRLARIRFSLRSRRVRQAASRASVLLAGNTSAKRDFERAFRRPVELLPETGVHAVHRPDFARFRSQGPLNLLWAADFSRPNALPLLLEAIANLGHDVDYRLHILGAGPLETAWKNLASEMGVRRRCSFLGELTPTALASQLAWAHLFVHTGFHNAPIAALLEALANGVPTMCFDHHSAADIVTPACGIKIAVTHPGQAIASMASAIRSLAQDRTPLLQLSAGACDRAQSFLWRENSARLMSIYRSIVRVAHRTAS